MRRGCGKPTDPFVWIDGPQHGPSFARGHWRAPTPRLCDDCQAQARAEAAALVGPWPPPQPEHAACTEPGCFVLTPWTWREGPPDGSAWEVGRWLHPGPLCTDHQRAQLAREREAELVGRLQRAGIPERYHGARFDRGLEIIEGESFGAFQRRLGGEARRLGHPMIGIAAWNEGVYWKLREWPNMPRRPSLYLVGPVGGGKTMLACALGCALIARGEDVVYYAEAALWEEIREARRHHRAEDIMRRCREAGVLLLDDLGTVEGGIQPWQLDMLEAMIGTRYNASAPLIITSNLPLQQLADAYGERIVSRLTQMTARQQLTIRGYDWRSGNAHPAPAADTT